MLMINNPITNITFKKLFPPINGIVLSNRRGGKQHQLAIAYLVDIIFLRVELLTIVPIAIFKQQICGCRMPKFELSQKTPAYFWRKIKTCHLNICYVSYDIKILAVCQEIILGHWASIKLNQQTIIV